MLDEARRAAAQAGYDTDHYDLDCVFCGSGFPVDQAYVRQKGIWLSSMDAGILGHELGHNFGLYHANAWGTSDGTIIGKGQNREYGNSFDTMGSGSPFLAPFGAYEKHLLDWLPNRAVTDFVSNGVYRLYPLDTFSLTDGQSYGLRFQKTASVIIGWKCTRPATVQN